MQLTLLVCHFVIAWLISISYVPKVFGMTLLIPIEINTQGEVQIGGVLTHNTLKHMTWVEGTGGWLSSFDQWSFINTDLSQLQRQNSIGAGWGRAIDANRVLKIYGYKGSIELAQKGPPLWGVSNHPFIYSAYTGGIEMQLPLYRVSLNAGIMQQGPGKYQEPLIIIPRSPSIQRRSRKLSYFELFRKIDIRELKRWGFSGQVYFHHYKRVVPYVGLYYNRVHLSVLDASFREDCVEIHQSYESGCDFKSGIKADFLYAKNAGGLSIGIKCPSKYIILECSGTIDTLNGFAITASINLPFVQWGNNASTSRHDLYYQSPVRHIGPYGYSKRIAAQEWDALARQPKGSLLSDDAKRPPKSLTLSYAKSIKNTLLRLASNNPDSAVSPDYLDDYLMRVTNNLYSDYNRETYEVKARPIPANYLYGFWEEVGDIMDSMTLERIKQDIVSNIRGSFAKDDEASHNLPLLSLRRSNLYYLPLLARLTQDETLAQLQQIQFLFNAAHLFHSLDLGSQLGVRLLLTNRACFQLPIELRLEIVQLLLLTPTDRLRILDQHYYNSESISHIMQNLINAFDKV